MEGVLAIVGAGLLIAALGYALGAIAVVARRPSLPSFDGASLPPVTIFKPLCGAEPGLYENLRTFFLTDYPGCQLIFGARRTDDPALEVVARLVREFPNADVAVVRDGRTYGANLKVSNLINMAAAARHDVWVLSDSDISVTSGDLKALVASLTAPGVGVATSLYRAAPIDRSLICTLGALHIDDWFLPSVLVARALGKSDFCLGAMIAFHRTALEGIGGFGTLKDQLADDYRLGQRIALAGKRVALVERTVATTVSETTWRALLRHELRWARTIASVEPLSFVFSCLQHTITISLIAGAMLWGAGAGPAALGGAIMLGTGARLGVHGLVNRRLGRRNTQGWLVPLRDVLSFVIWIASFFGRSVEWRGAHIRIDGPRAIGMRTGEGAHEDAVSESTVL